MEPKPVDVPRRVPRVSQWDLAEGVALLRHLWEPLKAVGYLPALTGGVIVRGHSSHDVDLVIYPWSSARQDRAALFAALAGAGLELVVDRETVHESWRGRGLEDRKDVTVHLWQGKRVDIIHCPVPHAADGA